MIDYDLYSRIKAYAERDGLNSSQIAQKTELDWRTVSKWLAEPRFYQRSSGPKPSKLDPYKDYIERLLEKHEYSAQQVLQKIREEGYQGGYTIVKDYVRKIRPPRRTAYLTLSFAPGECAQVDWGEWGSVAVGSTRRKLSLFVMVLCYSRMMYLEFTVRQTMEHFLACHQNAFEFFGGGVEKVMVDNLKSAVLKRLTGEAPKFNPRYLDFADHYGFSVAACNRGKGNEKGRVENGVGYVKKNLLRGLDIPDFAAIHPASQLWLDTIANVRIHGETKKRPCDMFKVEKPALTPLPENRYDVGVIHSVGVSNQFRVRLDTNRYSVPAEYASTRLTLKAYPDRICVYAGEKLVARHARSYDRHKDFEDPDHVKELLAQRRNARTQKLYARFLSISPKAEQYYQELSARRFNPRHHVQKIVALTEIYGTEKVARTFDDAFTFKAFSCEYIANLLEQRARLLPAPAALHLTRRQDLLDLDIPEPDLTIYESQQGVEDDREENTPITQNNKDNPNDKNSKS